MSSSTPRELDSQRLYEFEYESGIAGAGAGREITASGKKVNRMVSVLEASLLGKRRALRSEVDNGVLKWECMCERLALEDADEGSKRGVHRRSVDGPSEREYTHWSES